MSGSKTLADLQDKCRYMARDAVISVRCGAHQVKVLDIERISTHPEKIQIVVKALDLPRVAPSGSYTPECPRCNQLEGACRELLNMMRGMPNLSPESKSIIESIQNFLSAQSAELDLGE